MNHVDFLAWLADNDACEPARKWVAGNSYTPAEAWRNCHRGDWMLWMAARWEGADQVQIVRAVCACARLALQYVPTGEDMPRLAIEAAERWCDEPTSANATDATYAANAAANAAAYAATYAAADAANAAAYAADAAANAAANATYAAYAAAYAATYAAHAAHSAHAADAKTQKQTAQIVREIVTQGIES